MMMQHKNGQERSISKNEANIRAKILHFFLLEPKLCLPLGCTETHQPTQLECKTVLSGRNSRLYTSFMSSLLKHLGVPFHLFFLCLFPLRQETLIFPDHII